MSYSDSTILSWRKRDGWANHHRTCTFCKPGKVAMAPWRLLKLMPCKLSVVVWATGVDWFGLFESLEVPVTTFGLRSWNVDVELTVDGESACVCCWCDGLDSGDAVAVTLFFGDGVIKWVDDEPDESGDGPHLIWFGWDWMIDAGSNDWCSTYMETSRKLLSTLETRSMEPELHSLLMIDVVGDADPRNGNPGVIEKLPKLDEDALDAFESLPGDGAANESRRSLLLLFIKICCGGWAVGCCGGDFNWAKLKVDGLMVELDIRAGGEANWHCKADIVTRTFACCSGLNNTVCVCACLQEKYTANAQLSSLK